MRKYLLKISSFIEKIGKQNFILIIFIIFILGVTALYQTFSLYTESGGISILEGIKTFQFILNADNTENSVTIAAGSSKNIAITVSNNDEVDLKYGIYYSSNDDLTDVELGYLVDSQYPGEGFIKTNEDYLVTIKIYNDSMEDITINFGILYGVENGGDLSYESDQNPLEIIYPYQQQVEYLESTGTQYIDTNFYPNQDTSIEFVAETTKVNDILFWFGGRNNSTTTNGQTFLLVQMDDNRPRSDYNNSQDYVGSFVLSANTKYTIYKNKNVTSVDGVVYVSTTYGNFTSPSTLALFGVKVYSVSPSYNEADDVDYRMGHLKLYSCKIWDNGTLVRDYIPVVDRDGIPCLYDKVNNNFYYNQGTSGVDFSTNLIS